MCINNNKLFYWVRYTKTRVYINRLITLLTDNEYRVIMNIMLKGSWKPKTTGTRTRAEAAWGCSGRLCGGTKCYVISIWNVNWFLNTDLDSIMFCLCDGYMIEDGSHVDVANTTFILYFSCPKIT